MTRTHAKLPIVIGVTAALLIVGGIAAYALQTRTAPRTEPAPGTTTETVSAEATALPSEPVPVEPPAENPKAVDPTQALPPAAEPDSPATPLPRSRFAFVSRVRYGSPGSIVVDFADYLTGSAAAKAAAARGDESPPPNDYYIVNDDAKLSTFKIAENAKVFLVSTPDGMSDPAGYPSDLRRWAEYYAAPSDENAGIRGAGYWIVIDNGVVTAVREQFAP